METTVITLDTKQLELILGTIIVVGMSICCCLGFNAHRTSD